MAPTPYRRRIIKPIQGLLARCRTAGVHVIYVQSIRDPDALEFTVFGQKEFVLRNEWGSRIIEALAPRRGEAIVEKNSHDCFNNTRMEAVLAQKKLNPGDSHAIVVGLGLTNCVACAVTGFSVRNYRVVVPMDCTASMTREDEIVAYQRFMQNGHDYNVTLSDSPMITMAAEEKAGERALSPVRS